MLHKLSMTAPIASNTSRDFSPSRKLSQPKTAHRPGVFDMGEVDAAFPPFR
jgi:hypothetical protein